MIGFVIIYLIIAMITSFIVAKYDKKDREETLYIMMGLTWPVVLILAILLIPVVLAKSIKTKDGDPDE
jgi:biotin transporter BioY